MLEGGLCAATVLVSFGVLLGKVNPLQLLVLGLVETVLFTINCHVGYSMMGVVDAGCSVSVLTIMLNVSLGKSKKSV